MLSIIWFAVLALLPDTSIAASAGYADNESRSAINTRLALNLSMPERYKVVWKEWFINGIVRSPYTENISRTHFLIKMVFSLKIFAGTLLSIFTITTILLLLKRSSAWVVAATELIEGVMSILAIFVLMPILLMTIGSFTSNVLIASLALSFYPSMQLNNSLRFHLIRSKQQAWHIFAQFNQVKNRRLLKMLLREMQPPLVLFFNACGFLFMLGIPVAEWMLDLPGLGRWMLEGVLRLDIYVVYFASMILSLFACLSFMLGEIIEFGMTGEENTTL